MNRNSCNSGQSSEADSHSFCGNNGECNYREPDGYERKCDDAVSQKQRNHVEDIMEKKSAGQKGQYCGNRMGTPPS